MGNNATGDGFFHLPEWARGSRDYATATLADYEAASPEWRIGWMAALIVELKQQGAACIPPLAARLLSNRTDQPPSRTCPLSGRLCQCAGECVEWLDGNRGPQAREDAAQ